MALKNYAAPDTVQKCFRAERYFLAGSIVQTYNPTWGDHMAPEIVDEEGLWI